MQPAISSAGATLWALSRGRGRAFPRDRCPQRAAITTAQDMTAKGTRISYIRSTFAPEDGRCMCLFDAASETDVRRLNDTAGLPYHSVVAALDLTPVA